MEELAGLHGLRYPETGSASVDGAAGALAEGVMYGSAKGGLPVLQAVADSTSEAAPEAEAAHGSGGAAPVPRHHLQLASTYRRSCIVKARLIDPDEVLAARLPGSTSRRRSPGQPPNPDPPGSHPLSRVLSFISLIVSKCGCCSKVGVVRSWL
jgi:hypothetical protein